MKFIIHEDGEKEITVAAEGYRIHKPMSILNKELGWRLQTFKPTLLFSFTHPSYSLPSGVSEGDTELLHNVVVFHLHQMIDQYNGDDDVFIIQSEALLGVIKMMEAVLMLGLEEGRKKGLDDEKLVVFLCQSVSFSPPDDEGE